METGPSAKMDFSGDGLTDMGAVFITDDLQMQCEASELLLLTGATTDGQFFEGMGHVTTVCNNGCH
jgi:hypothetical protein